MIDSVADLVAFLKQFHHHWIDDPSLDPALIPASLPDGLAMVYRELGALVEIEPGPSNDHIAPFATQDALTPLSQVKQDDGMVTFAWENQGNWSARCPTGEKDPPVYSNAADSWDPVRRGFVVVCDSLNHFLTTLCLQEAVMGCRNLVALRTYRPPDQVLTVPIQPLWLNGKYVSGEPGHNFYVSPDHKVLVMDWEGVWIGSPFRKLSDLLIVGIECKVLH